MSSSALHNHKKVCLRFVIQKPVAGPDSKPSSGRGGDGSHSSSTRATPKKKDSKAPAADSQGSSTQPASQTMPCHSGRETSHHHKSHKDSKDSSGGKKKKKEASPSKWSSSHKACKVAAIARPASTPMPLFHQHSCIFSINCFVVKLMCLS